MDKNSKIVFLEENSPLAEMWLETLESREINAHGIVLEDDPFLPDNMTSIYEYFLLKEEKKELKIKDLLYVFVDIPEYWEVRADGLNGAIVNNGKRMATIYFKTPIEKRNVSKIEWLREDGNVFRIDYYNRYGIAYCSAYIDDEGFMYSKIYFTSENKDVVNINYSNGVVTIYHNGHVSNVYGSLDEFEQGSFYEIVGETEAYTITSSKQMRWMLQENDWEQKAFSIVLWKKKEVEYYKEKVSLLTPNIFLYILNNTDTCNCDVESISNAFWVCASKRTYPEVKGNKDILIYTYSDQLYSMERLIQDIPEARFHIAANTKVSQKLCDMSNEENVFVYPCITQQGIKELYEKCDLLLEINEDREVDNAVIEASKSGMLILGYEDLLHNRHYVLDECVFKSEDEDLLVKKVRMLIEKKEELAKLLQKQQERIIESTKCIEG